MNFIINYMYKRRLILLFSGGLLVANPALSMVKLSSSGLCHEPGTRYYERTQSFSRFSDLSQCLAAGGRLPNEGRDLKGNTSLELAVRGSSGVSSLYSSAGESELKKYSRSEFGNGWEDVNSDCRDSRAEALISQSLTPVRYSDSGQCKVAMGRWISPYSNKVIYKASDIDIDHVIPLKWAWDHGASRWPRQKRIKLANDPVNLLSVEASLNRSKGAKGPDEWMPPKGGCGYITRFSRLLITYELSVTDSERGVFQSMRDRYCKR